MTGRRHNCGHNIGYWSKSIQIRKTCTYIKLLGFMIGISFVFNFLFISYIYQYSISSELTQLVMPSKSNDCNAEIISTIERSTNALATLKNLLTSVASPHDQPWIWKPTKQYPSVPYQPSSSFNQLIPKLLHNITTLPQSVANEVNRVCQRLKQANKIGGKIWCELFNKSYIDTLITTTTILDDNSTYIVTGDIDLMWLRDSR